MPFLDQIIPIGIHFLDQGNFPGALPTLEVGLSTDCIGVKWIFFEVDQARHVVLLAEFRAATFAMRLNAALQIRRDADVERSVALAGEDVDEATWSSMALVEDWMGGSRPPMVE